jgi:hypothetical protein
VAEHQLHEKTIEEAPEVQARSVDSLSNLKEEIPFENIGSPPFHTWANPYIKNVNCVRALVEGMIWFANGTVRRG